MARTIEELERDVRKAEGYNAALNLMAKYTHYLVRYDKEGILSLFAEDPDTRAEMPWGVYTGREGLERCFNFKNPMLGDHTGPEGELHLRPLAVDLVQVADDCKTAQGAWYCSGVETGKRNDGSGDVDAGWIVQNYGVDFIFENGTWKIWHLHVYVRYQTTFDVDWKDLPPYEPYRVHGTTQAEFFKEGNPSLPDKKPTAYWGYHFSGLYPVDQPYAPKPYKDFSERKPN